MHNQTGLEFVLIPEGSFIMGSPPDEKGRWENEGPQHHVSIKPFLLCRTECTQEAWDRIGGEDNRAFKDDKCPIEGVTWYECDKWCKKVGLHLPSESEWEYACRAGSSTRFCFGDSDTDLGSYAWFNDNSDGKTHPVGEKKANNYGLYDMHGNVAEWCQDTRTNHYHGAAGDGLPFEDGKSSIRVTRGGSWFVNPDDCRSASRVGCKPDKLYFTLGFRPACSL
jgi:formylglycine-generating enzyme required for sulfatase activity